MAEKQRAVNRTLSIRERFGEAVIANNQSAN
jgi:hypothetical protein